MTGLAFTDVPESPGTGTIVVPLPGGGPAEGDWLISQSFAKRYEGGKWIAMTDETQVPQDDDDPVADDPQDDDAVIDPDAEPEDGAEDGGEG